MQKRQWKFKVQHIFQVCQDELKRTTEIGKKMLNASKTNTELHEAYEQLGVAAYQALKQDKLKWEDKKVHDLMKAISRCEAELESIEEEVQKIKFAAAPVDVSTLKADDDIPIKKRDFDSY